MRSKISERYVEDRLVRSIDLHTIGENAISDSCQKISMQLYNYA